MESQWKLRQQHDQNFPMEGKPLYRTNTSIRRKKQIQKSRNIIQGIFDKNQHSELINHLLITFKFNVCSARNNKQLNFDNLRITIKKIKEIEKELTSPNKLMLLKKWHSIDHMIDWYSIQNEKGGCGSEEFHFVFFFVLFLFFIYLYISSFCLLNKNLFPVLSCFINFIFNSFVISYCMYFVVRERKKRKQWIFNWTPRKN